MSWFEVVPVALVAAAWLWGPGLPVSYLLGLRGLAAFAIGPVFSIAVLASAAVIAQLAGLDWSILVALVAALVVIAIAGLLAFFLRRTGFLTALPDPRRLTLIALAGLLPAVIIATLGVMQGVGPPDSLSQVYDTGYHYNVLAYIRDTHDASSLTVHGFGDPETPAMFYPAAWHDLTSLVMMSTGASIPVAANVVCAVLTILSWPVSCLLLVRQLFGRNTAALAVAGVISIAFPAFPWDFFGWGVLWPNLLGMSIAPAVFALVLTVTGWVRDDVIGRGRGWLLLVVAIGSMGFAHPNVLFSMIVLSLFPAGAALFMRAKRLRADGRGRRGVVECAVFAVVVFGAWLWSATTPALANVRNWDWNSYETAPAAVGEVLLNATNLRGALLFLSVLVIAGAFTVRRFPALRWVLAGHLIAAFLYMLAASLITPATRMLIGYWYADSHRLAAMLPITGVPLAIAGMLFLAEKVLPYARRVKARIPAPRATTSVAVTLTAAFVVLTGGLYPTDREERIMVTYPRAENEKFVSDRMEAFYERIAPKIPKDSVVIGNPFDGSLYLWAIADRRVLFPHFLFEESPGQVYLARHLKDAATDPRVCQELKRYKVEYVLIGRVDLRINAITPYQGIAPVRYAQGFELVDRAGSTSLYRITAC